MNNTTIIKAWLICLSAASFFFYEFIQMNMFNAIVPELMRDFGLNATQIGTLSSCYFYANVLFLFPAGILLDRYSTKRIILIAMTLCVIGTYAFAHATTLWLAEICRFFTGIGSAFCFLSCIRLASRWFPSQRMALVTGAIVTMAMLGGIVAQTPLTLLVQSTGWRTALILDGYLGIVITFLIAFIVKDSPEDMPVADMHYQLQQIGFWRSLGLSLLKIQNWLGGFYTCLMNLPIILLGGLWGNLYLVQVHHVSRTQASNIVSMLFIGTVVGSPLVGWLSDRLALRRLPMLFGAIVSLLLISALFCMPILNQWQLYGLFLLLGLASSTQIISYPTIAESNLPLLTATAVSIVSFTTQSAGVVFQPLFGWLMDLHWRGNRVDHVRLYSDDNFRLALMILPIGFAIAWLAALWLRETHGRHQQ